MKKLRTAILGTLCIFASACVMSLTPSTPSAISSSPAVTAVFTGDPLKYMTPIPSVSSQGSMSVSPLASAQPSSGMITSPSVFLTPTSMLEPTWPLDVIEKNLSFVDWPEYKGVQFFRGMGSGIYHPRFEQRAYIGGLEVAENSGDLLVQMGNIDNTFGWADMKFDVSQGSESWKFVQCSKSQVRLEGSFDMRSCVPQGQEDFSLRYYGSDSMLDRTSFGGYDSDKKSLWFAPGFIPGSTEYVEFALTYIENLVLEKNVLNMYVQFLHRSPQVGIVENYVTAYNGVDEGEFFIRSLTLGERALYLVLPDARKRTLTIYAFLLPNLDRMVEFDVPFIDRSGFYIDYMSSPSVTRYPTDIIVLRYHPATKKLYLFIENQSSIREDKFDMLVQYIPHFIINGFSQPQLFRFGEDYVLQ